MSNPDPQDEQAVAESLDEDVLGADEVDDIGEDVVRATFPPDHQQGVDREPELEPDALPPEDHPVTGLMEADDDPGEEVAELGDREIVPPAEEAAVHDTAPPPDHQEDSYLDE